jgi:hypothetical protein
MVPTTSIASKGFTPAKYKFSGGRSGNGY